VLVTAQVQPIYNALDSANYRSALKLASKKDFQTWDLVKVHPIK
jgi:hypothetical protein